MILKYVGGAILVICGWLLGNSLYGIYSDRVMILQRIYDFLTFCEREIQYSKTELSVIQSKFTENKNPYDQFIFNRKITCFSLTPGIEQIIRDMLEKIGTLDSESQKKFFQEYEQIVQKNIEIAQKEVSVQGKMFRRLIPVVAIGIFILAL